VGIEEARLERRQILANQGFSNYLIFYKRTKDGVEVLRVLHGARDIEAAFDE
jgi:toxin ParE1/3/4